MSKTKEITLVVKADLFTKSLDSLTSIPERKNTIEMLENALFSVTENGRATAIMTDLEIEGSVTFQISASAAIDFIMPIEIIDFVKRCGDGEVTIKVAADHSYVKANQSRARMSVSSQPPGDFPRLTGPDEGFSFAMPAAEFCALIDTVAPAIGDMASGFWSQGVLVHSDEEKLVAVATNRHRLHYDAVALPDGANEMPRIIIPEKTCRSIDRAFSNAAGDVKISGTDRRFSIESDIITITSKLIDEQYPDYTRIIPKPAEMKYTTNVASLSKALTRMAVLRNTEKKKISGGAPCRIQFSDDMIGVRTRRPGSDDHIEDEVAATGSGEYICHLAIRYMLDALSKSGTQDVTLSPSENQIMRFETSDSDRFFLVMGVRMPGDT